MIQLFLYARTAWSVLTSRLGMAAAAAVIAGLAVHAHDVKTSNEAQLRTALASERQARAVEHQRADAAQAAEDDQRALADAAEAERASTEQKVRDIEEELAHAPKPAPGVCVPRALSRSLRDL